MPSTDSKIHILVVDDTHEDRELLRRLIERKFETEFVITETESGEEGLEICRSAPPDCVLLDYSLPDLDGIEFLNGLMDENGEIDIPVVMLTGTGNESIAVDAIKHGAQDYLIKGDVSAESLHRAVINAIEKTGLRMKLMEQNRELENFVFIASHDLKAPVRTISSFCGLLEKKYSGQLDEKAEKFITLISNASKQMSRLIDNLLEYSRAGNSFKQRKVESVDLNDILKNVLANIVGSIQESNSQIESVPLPTVQGEKTGLLQVFQNFISNAIKYRGEVTPVIKIEVNRQEDFWEIAVADNGIGIDPKYHDEVMKPFKRLHSMSEYEGTGLGLAICNKVIQRHGGRIWIDSNPENGSTFHFTIAASDTDELKPEPALAMSTS